VRWSMSTNRPVRTTSVFRRTADLGIRYVLAAAWRSVKRAVLLGFSHAAIVDQTSQLNSTAQAERAVCGIRGLWRVSLSASP
jgi:hypothetical protein